MAKLPFMQFYPADWLLDTHVLSPSTRGIWIDILSLMWREEPRTGTLEYTMAGWCKRLRCSDAELRTAVVEMEAENVCKILKDESKDSVRFISRRMHREEKQRKANRLYVRSYRRRNACNGDVTDLSGERKGDISEVIDQKSESEEEEKKSDRVSRKRSPPLTDEEWIESLKTNPAYAHVDFVLEFGKMDAWQSLPENQHRKRTRQFILNWIGKVPRPVVMKTLNGKQSCQERVQRGNFLKPCGELSVTVIGGRPLCQTHKEHHERRQSSVATA